MAAGIYNFTIEQGATFKRTFRYKDSNGNPISLSGSLVRMQIRQNVNSDVVIDEFTSNNNSFVLTTPAGGSEVNQINLEITATETAAFNFNNAVYDIEIDSGDEVIRLLQGKIKLSKEVTRDSPS